MTGILTFFIAALITFVGLTLLERYKKNKKKNTSGDSLEKEARKKLNISDHSELHYDKEATEWLDTVIAEGLLSGIKTYSTQEYGYLEILFNNDVTFYSWDNNKYYSWLYQGEVSYVDKETKEKVVMEYNEVQPTAYAMYKLKIAIDDFNNESYELKNVKVTKTKIDDK